MQAANVHLEEEEEEEAKKKTDGKGSTTSECHYLTSSGVHNPFT